MGRHHKKRCCWGGHFFASNVGVLPTECCGVNPKVLLSIPTKKLGCTIKKRRKRLRYALLHDCCTDVAEGVPTIDVRVQR